MSVTAIVDASEPARAEVLAAAQTFDPQVRVARGALPHVEPQAALDSAVMQALLDARRAYISAEFDRCLSGLADDTVLHRILARGGRQRVARVLFWRVACRVGAGDEPGAARDAARFAELGLAVPPDVDAATPDVEAALVAALRQVERAPRVGCEVQSNVRAVVMIDGRAAGCQTPCTVDLVPGDHVVSGAADGAVPNWQLVRVLDDGATVSLDLEEAPPDLAARQWTARWAERQDIDAAASVTLLARATRARRLVLLRVVAGGLEGVFTVDGVVAARASQESANLTESTHELMRELLIEGGVMEPAPGLVESPWLWIAVGVAAIGAAAVTAALLYDPPTRTVVGF